MCSVTRTGHFDHQISGNAIDTLMFNCVESRTLDNITGVLIGFEGFQRMCESILRREAPTQTELNWDKLE